MTQDLDLGRLPLLSPRELLAQIYALEERVRILENASGDGTPVDTNRLGPFAENSDTSRFAALANYPRSGSQRARILQHILTQADYGATRQETERDLGMLADAVRPRVLELINGGWLRVTDRTRLTPSGQEAEVIVATEKAKREHELKIEETRGFVSPEPVVSGAPVAADPFGAVDSTGAPETTLFTPPPAKPRGAYDEDQAA